MREWKIEKRKVAELKFYEKNPRKISEKMLEKLRRSLEEFGVVEPLVINPKNEVIGGNQRLKALQKLGVEEVDVVVVDLPKPKEKALNLALNRIQGEWDFELLDEFIQDIEHDIFEFTGFDWGEIGNVEVVEFEDAEKSKVAQKHMYGSDTIVVRIGDFVGFVPIEGDGVEEFLQKISELEERIESIPQANAIAMKILEVVRENWDEISSALS